MVELINCKVSFFCLLCFPLYTSCWRFSILREKEEMTSKLSPWACKIKLAYLQSAISIISYIFLCLQFVTSTCTKTNISMKKKQENNDWKNACWGQQWKLHPLSHCNDYSYASLETRKSPRLVRLHHALAWPQKTSSFPSQQCRGYVFKNWDISWTSSWSSRSILLKIRLRVNVTFLWRNY